MFKALGRRAESRALLSSRLFDERTFDKAFFRDLERARKPVIIEIPFMTDRRARYFAGIFKDLTGRGVRVRINTRQPVDHSGEMRYQAEAAIRTLRKGGVKVRIYDDMRHRKLAIIDGRILWEGSLNILSNGGRSREIMRRLDSRGVCRQLTIFISKSHSTGLVAWGQNQRDCR